MIDATPPQTPSYDDDIAAPEDPTSFSVFWYRFFDRTSDFLHSIRTFPPQVQQADLAKLLQKMITAKTQAGVQIWVPSYNHLLRFDGAKFTFAPGDGGSGYTQTFLTPPTADGWQLLDGSTVSYLKSDGTVADQILATTAGVYFRR